MNAQDSLTTIYTPTGEAVEALIRHEILSPEQIAALNEVGMSILNRMNYRKCE